MTTETFALFYKAITQGLIMGFCTAALLGPVNALAVRRGIVGGFQQTVGVGAGAAIVDAIWAYVVFAGLIKVGIVGTGKIIVWCLCAVFLLYLAYSMLMEIRDNPEMMDNPKVSRQIRFLDDSFIIGFLIAATNPFSLLRWIGLVGTLDVSGSIELTGGAATSFFSAVLVSEMVWFFGLGLVVQYSRNLFDRKALNTIKWVCGLILLVYALFMASKVVITLIHTGGAPILP